MAASGPADHSGDLIAGSGDGGGAQATVGRTPGEVARELGIAVVTLRSWERRYGIGPANRESGRHRRYLETDIAVLRRMCDLIGAGLSPARAAELARSGLRSRPGDLPVGPGEPAEPIEPIEASTGRSLVGDSEVAAAFEAEPTAGTPDRTAARGLIRTATRMDDLACRHILESALTARGVINAWDEVMLPALTAIGQQHAATGRCVEIEHLLSVTVSAALASVYRPRPDRVRSELLLACADEEQHSLALEAVAAALAERDTGVRLLGARTPPGALDQALRRTTPTAVLLWSQLESTGDPAQLERLLQRSPCPIVLAGGPGWYVENLPSGVRRPTHLRAAVDLLRSCSGSID